MLVFAKDISNRDHVHSREKENPALKEYMDYQRKLFPYTVIRAGLDLAYKELDDILGYQDNEGQPPADSNRKEYPADIPAWYKNRFPWSAAFLDMETMHFLLVTLVKAMDSFRTFEIPTTYHLAVLYDATHNIVQVYNELLSQDPRQARDIRLSQEVAVSFDDFINNYWPHLEFMIFSRADYPHTRLLEKNHAVEEAIRGQMAEGNLPAAALEIVAVSHDLHEGTLTLLRHDPPDNKHLELKTLREKPEPDDSRQDGSNTIDAEYEKNFYLTQLPTTS